jgi:hypothetical protein
MIMSIKARARGVETNLSCERKRQSARRRSRAVLPDWDGLELRLCLSQGMIVPGAPQGDANVAFGQLPLAFEPNRGQANPAVDYLAHGTGYTLWLSQGDAMLDLGRATESSAGGAGLSASTPDAVLHMHLVGAAMPASSEGLEPAPGQSNYFLGNEPSGWLTEVPQYARVVYHDVYPGIDAAYHGAGGHQLEYDFDLAPGANPGAIDLAFGGASQVAVDAQGELTLDVGNAVLRQPVPVAYQEIAGVEESVQVRYVLRGAGQVGFELGPYDSTLPVVIDPALVYSTYLGGSGNDSGNGIALDGFGNVYVVGTTSSPWSPSGNSETFGNTGFNVAFVTKLSPKGEVIYSDFYGGGTVFSLGSGLTQGLGIAVDDRGNAYFTGDVEAFDLPLVNPLPHGQKLGGASAGSPASGSDAFVAKLGPDGSRLLFSTYLGGTYADQGNGIAVDTAGDIFVVGATNSRDDQYTPQGGFPVAGDVNQTTYGGQLEEAPTSAVGDAFVSRIHLASSGSNILGSSLVYSTYLGGSLDETGEAIAVDAEDDAYVTGYTNSDEEEGSTPFPTTAGSFQPTNHSGAAFGGLVPLTDAFVTKFAPTGRRLYSSYLGGGRNDLGVAIAVDATGRAYVTGFTYSQLDAANGLDPFPVTAGAIQKSLAGSYDAFLSVVAPDGSSLEYSTYLGGSGGDAGQGIGLGPAGEVFIAGGTESPNLPGLKAGEPGLQGITDAFVAKFTYLGPKDNAPATAELDSLAYLGGSGYDEALGMAVDTHGSVFVTGTTTSTDFPVVNPAQDEYAGGGTDPYSPFIGDAFVARIPGDQPYLQGLPIQATRGQTFSGPVANFAALDPDVTSDNFSAVIDWGDGTISPGKLVDASDGNGIYQILGTHRYTRPGAYGVVVTVHDQLNDVDITPETDVTRLALSQAGEDLAVNPANPLQEFVVSEDPADTGGLIGSVTDDGGVTWTVRAMADGNDFLPVARGFPRVAWDAAGTLVMTYVTTDGTDLAVAASGDGGRSFTPEEIASPNAGVISSPSIAVGPGPKPGSSSVWVSFFSSGAGESQLYAAGGLDSPTEPGGGLSNPEPVIPEVFTGEPVFASIAVGPDGSAVVDWESGINAQGPEDVFVSVDPDGLGPMPFAPPSPNTSSGKSQVVVHSQAGAAETGPASPVNGFNVGAELAFDTAKRNRLYMVYTDRSGGSAGSQDTVIQLIFSDDGGKTWSDPVQVSDSQDSTQFQPSIAVDPITGDVAVGWYDTVGDSERQTTHYRVAASVDGGVTFSPDEVIASGASNASDPDLSDSGRERGYGDHSGLAFARGVVYAGWADNSPDLAGNPDRGDFDVAAARIGIAHVKDSPVTVLPVQASAVEGREFSGPVAVVTDPDPNASDDNYTAAIDWGDGVGTADVTTGDIEDSSSGDVKQLIIVGSHIYEKAGSYPIVVSVVDASQGTTSTTAADVSAIEGNQVGGVVTADPTQPGRYFAVSRTESQTGLYAAITVDAGGEWDPVGQTDHLIADGTDGLPVGSGAASATYDSFGNLFLAYADQTADTVVVIVSLDGGQTFDPNPVAVFHGDALDLPVLAASDGAYAGGSGSVWVAYYDYVAGAVEVAGAKVEGFGQVGAFMAPEAVPGSSGVDGVEDIAVGDQGQVLVAFAVAGDDGKLDVEASVDADGLDSGGFAAPVLVGPTGLSPGTTIPALGSTPLAVVPQLGWSSAGLHEGTAYVTYNSLSSFGQLGVVIQSSADSGATWGSSTTISGNSPGDAFLPGTAIDHLTGNVGVAWYQAFGGEDPQKAQVITAVSSDGGQSFHISSSVEFGPSDATASGLNAFGESAGFGGPVGLAYSGSLLVPAWSDNSDVLSGNPDLPQFDLAAAPIGIAQVADAPLTAAPIGAITVQTAQGHLFQGVVATFTDANPFAAAADFTATIDWGEGQAVVEGNGTVVSDGQGGFQVTGEHTFHLAPATYAFLIKVTIKDKDGAVASTETNLIVAKALSAVGESLTEYRARPVQEVVGEFTDYDSTLTADDFMATIKWDDGDTSDGIIQAGGPHGLAFAVVNEDSVSFDTVGQHDATLTITAKNGDTATSIVRINVLEELDVVAKNLSTHAGADFSGTVASLTDADPGAAVDQYDTPKIDWGDGSLLDQGTVIGDPGSKGFLIVGEHVYAKPGQYAVVVTVNRLDGPVGSAIGTASVKVPEITAGSVTIPALAFQGITTSATGSFQVDGASAPGDDQGTIDWGDQSASAGTITVNGTTITVSGSHIYTDAGNDTVTVSLDGPFGSTGSESAAVDVAADVSSQVSATGSGLIFNPQTQLFNGTITLKNAGTSALEGPILDVVLEGLPAGVQLVNAAGSTSSGAPYLTDDLNLNPLGPGQVLPPLPTEFSDPSLGPISFTVSVFSDPPPWYEAALADLSPPETPKQRGVIVPPGFEPNVGQADASMEFVAATLSGVVGLTEGGTLVASAAESGALAPSPVRLNLLKARADVAPRALALQTGTVNYLFGSDPSGWLTDVPTFGQVVYAGVYPGVDLVYRTGQDGLEYDFVVAPGADPGAIAMNATGGDSVALDSQGNLVIHTSSGDVTERAPVLYQKSGAVVHPVSGGFVLDTDGRITFQVGSYDRTAPLVIDPVLGFSTLFGGYGNERAFGVSVDPAGNSYIAGSVDSYSFETFPLKDPFQGSFNGTTNQAASKAAFVAKFDPDGNLVYSTLLGGDRITEALGISVDASGDAYVTGRTESINFPVLNPIQGALGNPEGQPGNLGSGDAFLTKLSADGSSLVYSTYLGGSADDLGAGVAVDTSGNAYVTGTTGSQDFPTANPLQPQLRLNALNQPSFDVFVAKVSPSGAVLVYSTYLGGSGDDAASGIAVDASGDAYVTGAGSYLLGFPGANNGNLPTRFTAGSAFVSELNPDGSKLLFSTTFGGGVENSDHYLYRLPGAIALDAAGDIYLAGSTMTNFFPTTANAFQPGPGQGTGSGFVVKLSASDQLVYSTYLRGSNKFDQEFGTNVYGLAVDANGDAYVVGDTLSRDFPTKDAVQPVHGDDQDQRDGFLTELDPTGSALVTSTYLGGGALDDWSGDDFALGVALDARGHVYVAGGTRAPDFPTTPGAFQRTIGGTNDFGSYDAFLVRIDGPSPTVDLGVLVQPVSATEGIPFQALVATFSDPRPGAAAGDYTATIDWGDGSTSGGTVTADPAQAERFLVSGAHTYKDEKNYAVTVTVARSDGSGTSPTASGTATVADAPLTAIPASVTAVEGQPFHGRVATFLDASPFELASSYTATIDWGDGQTSAGTIAADGSFSGQFGIDGNHIYEEAGAYPVRVTIHDNGGSTATTSSTVAATASAGEIKYHVFLDTQGISTDPAILRFQFNPGALPDAQQATATIKFGGPAGGSFDPVVLVNSMQLNQAGMSIDGIPVLSFEISLSGDAVSHPSDDGFGSTLAVQLLAGDGKTPLLTSDPSGAVFLIDLSPDGSATARSLAAVANSIRPAILAQNVADAPLSAAGTSIDADRGEKISKVIARFDDLNSFGTIDDFSATIHWGDATSSPGSVALDEDGSARFEITGTHTYARAGSFGATVSIVDAWGSAASATTSIHVTDNNPGGSSPQPGGDGKNGTPTPPPSGKTPPSIGIGKLWLVGVERFGVHNQPTRLVLRFSEPLNVVQAANSKNYRVVAAGRDGVLGDRDDVIVPVAKIVYRAGSPNVALGMGRRINIHHPYRLTIRGSGSNTVTDQAGRPLVGDHAITVKWTDVVLPKPGGRGKIGLERLRHLVWPAWRSARVRKDQHHPSV